MDDSQKIKLIELEKIRDDEQIADQKESIEVLTKDYDDMVLAKDTELDKKEQEKNEALTKKDKEIKKKNQEIQKAKDKLNNSPELNMEKTKLIDVGIELVRDIKSRKFLLVVGGIASVIGNATYDWGLTETDFKCILGLISGYVLVEGIADIIERLRK